jgi:hypothetical protein
VEKKILMIMKKKMIQILSDRYNIVSVTIIAGWLVISHDELLFVLVVG